MQNNPLNFSLKADIIVKRIFWPLFTFELLIVFLDVFVNHYKWSSIGAIRRLVNITREDSLSNWFSSLQVIFVGLTIFIIAIIARKKTENRSNNRKVYCWYGIACFFIYLGIDDAIKFHERIGTAFKVIVSRGNGQSSDPGVLSYINHTFPSYTWQLVFGPFLIAIAAFILWFMLKELSPRRQQILFIIAIELYMIAVGIDFVEGLKPNPYYKGIADFFSTNTKHVKHMSKTLEEFIEMFGTTIILTVFLRKLFSLLQKVEITIVKDRK